MKILKPKELYNIFQYISLMKFERCYIDWYRVYNDMHKKVI